MESYFSKQQAKKRFFFIVGMTDDEFYTDSGRILNIEELVLAELKRSGYERVVFYDENTKLHCYDEDSFALMRVNGMTRRENAPKESLVRKNKGLGSGSWGKRSQPKAPEPEEKSKELSSDDGAWAVGETSGIRIRSGGKKALHLGMQDAESVKRQINSYMEDYLIQTAIVIKSPDAFRKEFGDMFLEEFTTGYARKMTRNLNIFVFLETAEDSKKAVFYKKDESEEEKTTRMDAENAICISYPNALEIRNIISYFRINRGLKLKLRNLNEISLALYRAFMVGKEVVDSRGKTKTERLRSHNIYWALDELCKQKAELSADMCYDVLGVKKPKTAEEQLNGLIGMESVKQALFKYKKQSNEKAEMPLYQTSSRLQPDRPQPELNGTNKMIHIIITGSPGTGKTTVAKLIGQLFYEMGYLESGHLVETDREGLVAGYVGQTAIKTREKVMEAMGGVLFVDEAYSLKREGDSKGDFGQEAIDTLVKAMDEFKGRFILVAAGYKNKMELFEKANEGFSSRFTLHLHIDDYAADEMMQILLLHVKKRGYRLSENFMTLLPDFCDSWVNSADEKWGNAREAVNLMDAMENEWRHNKQIEQNEKGDTVKILETTHIPEKYRAHLVPISQSRAMVLENLNSMIGLASVKEQIENLRLRIAFGNSKTPGHYCFVGNPGTGKTTIARYMGQILRNLGMLKHGRLKEYTARTLITEVQKPDVTFESIADQSLGGVFFIDEAYQLVDSSIGTGILDALLPYMEKHEKEFTVILAGYAEDMKRIYAYNAGFESRFEQNIEFENYTADELYQIFMKVLEGDHIRADEDFKEACLALFRREIPRLSGRKSFGNARTLRKEYYNLFIDRHNHRVYAEYGGNIPEEEKKHWTLADVPEHLDKLLEGKPEKRQQAVIPRLEMLEPREVIHADTLPELKKKSVVFILTDQGSGTGSFITRSGYILTCNHVVEGCSDVRVFMHPNENETDSEEAEVVWTDKALDAAILKIQGGEYPALALRPLSVATGAGEPIFHWGYPFGLMLSDDVASLQPSIFEGKISSVQTKDGHQQINVDMAAKSGCSGGPVFSKRDGTLLGILCGSKTHTSGNLTEEINYVLPVRYIWEYVVGK